MRQLARQRLNGLVEAGTGVRVSGGNSADVGMGVLTNGTDFRIAVDGQLKATFGKNICEFRGQDGSVNQFTSSPQYTTIRAKNTTVNNPTLLLETEVDKADLSQHRTLFINAPTYTNIANNASLSAFSVSNPKNDAGASGVKYHGYQVLNLTDKFDTNYGFYSQVSKGDKTNFNFFATTDAPNFFKGDTYIGGTAVRNTLELWESTLTEEQKEQLSAGTLALPANVSTPGDGSFVRQWWYDQQSAEDQALIDSGELDYPERYRAENFVDTFELGVTTNINLLSNGRGEFGGGIKVTGGTASSVSTGIIAGSSEESLVLLCSEKNVARYRLDRGWSFDKVDTMDEGYSSNLSLGGRASYSTDSDDKKKIPSSLSLSSNFTGALLNKSGYAFAKAAINEPPTNLNDISQITGYYAHTSIGSVGCLFNYGFKSELNQDAAANSDGKQNYNFYAEGTAPNYFEGITEHKGGVKVTGGTVSNKGQGFIGAADASNGRGLRIMVGDMTRSGGSVYGLSYYVDGDSINIDSDQFFNLVDVSPSFDLECSVSAYNTLASNISGNVAAWVGYNADLSSAKDNITNGYGFYSNIRNNTSDGRSRFNFYAAGNAPNYFSGTVIVSKDTKSTSEILGGTKTGMYFNASTGGIAINKDDNNGNLNLMQCMRGGTATTRRFLDFRFSGTTNKLIGWIDATESAVAYRTTSDYRLKENIAPLTSASDRVKQLNPCSFNFIGVDETAEGFIAHEIQEVVPATASGTKDETEAIGTLADYDGTVLETEVTEPSVEELEYTEDVTDSEGVTTQTVRTRTWTATGTRPVYQGVDQTKLIPLLTKALQEALDKIEVLEQRLSDAGIA